jgi:hypothetical protein
MKEGYCDEEIYKLIRQKMGDTTIKSTVSVNNCNSDYFNLIKSRLESINFSAPSFTFSSYESGILPSTSTPTSSEPSKPTDTACPKEAEKIKCVADFGTKIGDPLCCGQQGVLQNTRYVCPNTLKKCSNFRCGSAFGTCM